MPALHNAGKQMITRCGHSICEKTQMEWWLQLLLKIFVYSWRRVSRSKTGYLMPVISNMLMLKILQIFLVAKSLNIRWKLIDPHTLQVNLTKPLLFNRYGQSHTVGSPLKEIVENMVWIDSSWKLVGNGAYVSENWVECKKKVTLKRNPLYWDKNTIIEQAIFLPISLETSDNRYRSGETISLIAQFLLLL